MSLLSGKLDVKRALGLMNRLSLSRRQIFSAAMAGALVLFGTLIYRFVPEKSFSRQETGPPQEGRRAPPLVRKGKTIFIPEGSPYRSHIAVAPGRDPER